MIRAMLSRRVRIRARGFLLALVGFCAAILPPSWAEEEIILPKELLARERLSEHRRSVGRADEPIGVSAKHELALREFVESYVGWDVQRRQAALEEGVVDVLPPADACTVISVQAGFPSRLGQAIEKQQIGSIEAFDAVLFGGPLHVLALLREDPPGRYRRFVMVVDPPVAPYRITSLKKDDTFSDTEYRRGIERKKMRDFLKAALTGPGEDVLGRLPAGTGAGYLAGMRVECAAVGFPEGEPPLEGEFVRCSVSLRLYGALPRDYREDVLELGLAREGHGWTIPFCCLDKEYAARITQERRIIEFVARFIDGGPSFRREKMLPIEDFPEEMREEMRNRVRDCLPKQALARHIPHDEPFQYVSHARFQFSNWDYVCRFRRSDQPADAPPLWLVVEVHEAYDGRLGIVATTPQFEWPQKYLDEVGYVSPKLPGPEEEPPPGTGQAPVP